MNILRESIPPGKATFIKLKVASLYTRTEIEIPIIIERAASDGPKLLVMGGIHGDEINGIEIVRRLIFGKYIKPQRGTVICIPIVNVMAFLNLERKFADGRDLNRSFPGNKNGSLAAQVANSITQEIISQIDYVIDLHAGGNDRYNFPQIRYDLSHPENIILAQKFNAPVTFLQSSAPQGSIRKLLNSRKIPIVIFEGGKSRQISEDAVQIGLEGVLNVMAHLGLRKPDADNRTGLREYETINISSSRWIRAKHSGMFQPVIENGIKVDRGQLLGFINGPFAQFHKKVTSPIAGHIICVNETPVVYKGDALFHIGQQ